MPVGFDLEQIRKVNGCEVYVETGLYDPTDPNISIRKALDCGFSKLMSIEIFADHVDRAKKLFSGEIATGRLRLVCDDSRNLREIIEGEVSGKTIFFLDSHLDHQRLEGIVACRCPVLEELAAIRSLPQKDHVILIDDLRIMRERYPWGERRHGEIDFVSQIMNTISEINPLYRFETLRGIVDDDVLYAYVP